MDIRNNAGQRPFDLVEFDDAEVAMQDEEKNESAGAANSSASMLRPEIYSSLTHTFERKSVCRVAERNAEQAKRAMIDAQL